MRAFFTDRFVLPLPSHHRFPLAKYARLRERAVAEGVLDPKALVVPHPAGDDELRRVHTTAYVRRLVTGAVSRQEMRRIGFPWSAALLERSRRSVGATIGAGRSALEDGKAVTLAGGTHHAFPAHGEGFCVFNDVAVAVRALQAEGRVRRVVILDCDVHQGNGTAQIFAGDPTAFTFDVFAIHNFPFPKSRPDLEIRLPDGTADDAYLAAVDDGVRRALERARADLAVYLAGADPYAGDRLGRLALTKAGLAERDRLVLSRCRAAGVPVAVTMAGGYAEPIDDTVEIHLETVRATAMM